METKKQNYTLPIIVMIFLFGMISFVTNLASPMGDILKYQFNVPNWMGTLGVFANFIAYAIMGYPAGNMLQKYGYKKTALVAIARRLYRRRHPDALRLGRELRRLSARRLHRRFLHVFAQHRREPDAQQARRRRKQRQSAHSGGRLVQLALRHGGHHPDRPADSGGYQECADQQRVPADVRRIGHFLHSHSS